MLKKADKQPTIITPSLINKADLILKEVIGEGHFGVVIKAIWKHGDDNEIECAVKSLKQTPEKLIPEIVNMQKLRHENIVQLYGVCLEKPVLMVLELCEGGTLADRLKDHSKPLPLATTLLKYAIQIAEGMRYLETQEYVHRDLAARNILLTKDEQTAKIADFGLSRQLDNDQYLMSENAAIPFPWCPPESLRSKIFSSHSDSWAFGVTIWEMFQYGKEDPWQSLSLKEVLEKLEAGQRLSKPPYCPKEIYKIMLKCWDFVPQSRPNFTSLIKKLKRFEFHLFDLNKKEKTAYEIPIGSKNSNVLIVIDFGNANNTFLVQDMSNGNFCILSPDEELIEIENSDLINFPSVQRKTPSSRTKNFSDPKPPISKKPMSSSDQKISISNEYSALFPKNFPTQPSPTPTQYEHKRTSTPPLPTRRNRSNKNSPHLRDTRVIERKWLIVMLIIIIIVIAVVAVIVTRNYSLYQSPTPGTPHLIPFSEEKPITVEGCTNGKKCSRIGSIEATTTTPRTTQLVPFSTVMITAKREDPILLLSTYTAIYQYDLSTNQKLKLVDNLNYVRYIDYWLKGSTIIWSDTDQQKIYMCNLIKNSQFPKMIACDDNGNHTVLIGHSISYPESLAVDWIHGLLFWVDSRLKTINVMDLNTKQRKVLFEEDFDRVQAIAVDPSKDLIFWTDWNKKAIERASMDGNDRMTIAKSSSPYGIALDIFNERVYWADYDTKTIASVGYNGNDRRTILHSRTHIKNPFSLAIFEEKLYWADRDQKGVLVMNKFNGTEVRQLISGVDNPKTVRVYHSAAQPELPNKCDQHSCGDGAICLPKGNSFKNRIGLPYSCVCADGYTTGKEPNTCVLRI